MAIREREVDGVRILDLKGKITGGEGSAKLKQRLADLVDAGYERIVINLAGVPYVDSSGLGELVRCFTAAQKAGGGVKLSSPSRRLIDLFNLTKLSTILDICDTDAEAIESFTKR